MKLELIGSRSVLLRVCEIPFMILVIKHPNSERRSHLYSTPERITKLHMVCNNLLSMRYGLATDRGA